jgi:ubiquinone/menaquinone biosynthesis C-methylase UbiE
MTTSTQWQLAHEAAERYERILTPAILGPAARALGEWSALRDGETVLDIGCGTGAAARFAAEKVGLSGRVAGVDINSAMIDVARSLPPVRGASIEWFENSADDLPFVDHSFDAVLCAQTLQFLSNRRGALAEIYRVLKPGGRATVSTWCDIQDSPYFYALVEAINRHIGSETAQGLKAAFNLTDPDTIRSLLTNAGYQHIDMIVKPLDLPLPNLVDFVPSHVSATPMSVGFKAAAKQAQLDVVQEVSDRLAPYQTDTGVCVPFRTHFAMGKK